MAAGAPVIAAVATVVVLNHWRLSVGGEDVLTI
jgi:hypothetical protein